ncbi:MAG TPA: sodium/proline symporter PutP [Anaerovoracaceae bacterium]|nr:sodium/proline symporter PutP [Anaerovoracaceae bacterium]
MTTNEIYILLSIIIYLIFIVAIGIFYSKRNENVSDFYLGGRRLGPFVTAMSAEASDMSSWLLMGLPGVAYISGLGEAAWTGIGLAIGTYLNWLFVAKRIREYSHQINAITIPDFFNKRYHDNKNIIGALAAVVIIIFFIPYTASGFAACGKLFSSLFGIEYMTAMLISATIIVAYTTLGGFLAASTSDFIQSIVMSIALIVVLTFGISTAGGFDNVMANASEMSGYLSLNAIHDIVNNESVNYGFITIVSTLAWGLGYFGMPHVLLRFMAIQERNKLVVSRRIATTWVAISLCVAIFIGIIGNAMSSVGAIENLQGSGSETVIIQIANLLSTHGVFPAIIAGIILAGILAATMSTSDSQLLAASSGVSQDLMNNCFHIKLSKKTSMIVARTTVVIISIVAVLFASNPDSSVFEIVSFAWAGFGACFGPVVLSALFWKRSTKQGAIAGMITGGLVIFVWKYLVRPLGGAFNIYELLPAFICALLAIVLVSLATKEPDESILEEYKRVEDII